MRAGGSQAFAHLVERMAGDHKGEVFAFDRGTRVLGDQRVAHAAANGEHVGSEELDERSVNRC